jgi:amidohydrolase
MLEAGVLDDPRVDEVYGLHLTTRHAAGHVRVRPGPSLSSADFFDVEVLGRGGHGAYPHLAADPITTAARILLGLQHLVAYETDARETAVMTVGQFSGGTKHNVLPGSAVLRGSIRTFSDESRRQLKERLAAYASLTAQAHHAEARVTFAGGGCPAVVNDAAASARVHRCAASALGADRVEEGPRGMASDDVSLFLAARPGCYFNVGAAPGDGRLRPHHAPEFEIDESSLVAGLRVGAAVMLDALDDGAAAGGRG